MRRSFLIIFVGLLPLLLWAQNGELEQLAQAFQDPPVEARPRAYFDWINGNFSLSAITAELEEAKAKGMGGFDIWDVGVLVDPMEVIPDGPPFMGPQSVQAIGHTVREAERLELDIGLTISSSWNAGGAWVQPEHGVMGLFRSTVVVEGPQEVDRQLPFPDLPERYRDRHPTLIEYDDRRLPTFYREVAVLAIPLRSDSTLVLDEVQVINGAMDEDGRLRWSAPPGRWRITRYVCAPTGQPLMIPSPRSMGRMIDHFSAEATRAHLNLFFERLQAELGTLENRALKYLYTDSYEANSAAWTPTLPDDFQQRRGYSLTRWLPVLDSFIVETPESSARFLFDFKKTLSDLIVENHYALSTQLCTERGLGFHAEAGGPGPPVHNVPFEDLRALGALTVPRGEFWNRHPRGEKHTNELQIVKGVASASHLYDQTYVEAEAFTSVWLWQEGPAELKPLADRAFCEGLNRIVYHTWPHRPPESGDPGWIYNFGTLVNTSRTWWPKSRAFHDYLARCSYLLQQGNFVGDVAYYYGHQAPNFVTYKKVDPSLGFGYDYDVINSEAILERLAMREGRLQLPHGQMYEVLVLPNQQAIHPAVLQKLETMVHQGLTLVGPRPSRAHSLHQRAENDALVRQIADRLWGPVDSVNVQERSYGAGKVIWGKPLRTVLQEKNIGPDLTISGAETLPPFDFIHRRTENADIYFIWNKSGQEQRRRLSFRISDRRPQLWDPVSGTTASELVYDQGDGRTSLPLYLPPNGSVFVVFAAAAPVAGLEALTRNGQTVYPVYHPDGPMVDHPGEYQLIGHDGRTRRVAIDALPDPVPLEGAYEIRFPHGWGAPPIDTFEQLRSWTDSDNEAIRHFSGVAAYHKSFELESNQLDGYRLFLDLGEVQEVADVYLNGHRLGIRWHAPYRYDITETARAGTNHLIVEVANVLSNRLTGDWKRPADQRRTKTNVIKGPNAWMTPWADVPLKPSGLMGPVRIEFGKLLE